jgi:diaminohydroxyphosphoribosylaminopyrimidine deaminase/5-amino-6-(5-phosphoribosylamino)uracil reductase
MKWSSEDVQFMKKVIEKASKRKGLTLPNPTVACIIVKNGKIIAEGVHYKAGYPHAEVEALKKAGKEAEGSTVYVNLEPCSHYGRTPPCALELIKAKVKKVVIATEDPNPLVKGKGIEMLKKAGIEVVVGVLKEEAYKLNEDFFFWISHNKFPFITLKVAETLNGIIGYRNRRLLISSEEALKVIHKLRCESSAILVGIDTVITDDPLLTIRNYPCEKQPLRVILDTHLRIPLNARIIKEKSAPLLIFTAKGNKNKGKIKFLREEGIEVREVSKEGRNLNLKEILNYLGKDKEVVNLLVEGGNKIFKSFIEKNFFNRILIFLSSQIAILDNSSIWFRNPIHFLEDLNQSLSLKFSEIRKITDTDLLIELRKNNFS